MQARVDFLLSTYRVRLVAGTLMDDWDLDQRDLDRADEAQ